MSVPELTKLVNDAIGELTGKPGAVGDLTVYRWVRGEVRWPNERQRLALQHVTGRTAVQLGFRPRGKTSTAPTSLEEDPVYRRALLAAAAAAGVSIATPATATPQRRRLGSTDVDKLNAELAAWTSTENLYGGTIELEQRAADLTGKVVALQQSASASARIRSELYTVAAAFSNSAMWAAIDGRRLDAARQHMQQTVTLAGLSGDPGTQFRVWNHASILFDQLKRPADSVAAIQTARSSAITRRDPLFASLTLARLAICHANAGEDRDALRCLDMAQKALDRAEPKPRPAWIDFYDQAELDHLAMIVHMRLGRWPGAEQHAHRSLAYLRPDFERNRALVHANLALAQLGQGDLEQAVFTARAIPQEKVGHRRVRKLLDGFTRQITVLAPRNPAARDWQTYYRTVAA